jgi:ribosome-binding protein aMBF1 (putative translation factor)
MVKAQCEVCGKEVEVVSYTNDGGVITVIELAVHECVKEEEAPPIFKPKSRKAPKVAIV